MDIKMGEFTLNSRIQKVVEYSNFTVRKFSLECGLKQSTFDKHFRGSAEPNASTLVGICRRFPEISMDWLLIGEGEMLKGKAPQFMEIDKMLNTIDALNKALAAQGETIKILKDKIKELEK